MSVRTHHGSIRTLVLFTQNVSKDPHGSIRTLSFSHRMSVRPTWVNKDLILFTQNVNKPTWINKDLTLFTQNLMQGPTWINMDLSPISH